MKYTSPEMELLAIETSDLILASAEEKDPTAPPEIDGDDF